MRRDVQNHDNNKSNVDRVRNADCSCGVDGCGECGESSDSASSGRKHPLPGYVLN